MLRLQANPTWKSTWKWSMTRSRIIIVNIVTTHFLLKVTSKGTWLHIQTGIGSNAGNVEKYLHLNCTWKFTSKEFMKRLRTTIVNIVTKLFRQAAILVSIRRPIKRIVYITNATSVKRSIYEKIIWINIISHLIRLTIKNYQNCIRYRKIHSWYKISRVTFLYTKVVNHFEKKYNRLEYTWHVFRHIKV